MYRNQFGEFACRCRGLKDSFFRGLVSGHRTLSVPFGLPLSKLRIQRMLLF